MLDGIIVRGTNPEHEFELPYPFELIESICIIYGQGAKPILKKNWKKEEGDSDTCRLKENKVYVLLSQEDTYLVSPSKTLDIEIRIKLTNGKIIRSDEMITLRVIDTMDNEVMK